MRPQLCLTCDGRGSSSVYISSLPGGLRLHVSKVFYNFPYVSCSCLINELAHPRLRGRPLHDNLPIWESSDWSWRLPALLQAFGPLILVSLLVPESPRFLLSKFQGEQALDILAKFYANGDHEDELHDGKSTAAGVGNLTCNNESGCDHKHDRRRFAGRAAVNGALGAFLNPIGLKSLQWQFYFVFLAIQIMYLFLIWWFFIETKGHTIEQSEEKPEMSHSGKKRSIPLEKVD
ncbi:hypothetical protein BT96DRAFT_989560 [Gymnopus androsaceus JB14]|uniref:Major facilitator superfamily (MFS) profile domain-containing protein n=1 Tax=Gymnopus androsaceus JB14 TaxID=1447944 RepID=A0A6A4I699_9AGAR|nr:hypothetical protein BT96DRAFT_989560 [Gymnopus androsaceus JB14]